LKVISQFDSVPVVAISMFTAVVATLAVNIAANVVSPANDFANAFPRWISFRTGGLITGVIGIVMQPWKLLADPSAYIFTWLNGYSGGLGSIAGVLIADYWLVRDKKLALGDLYRTKGVYAYPKLTPRRIWLSWKCDAHSMVEELQKTYLEKLEAIRARLAEFEAIMREISVG
jgi:nucleobase:cation symporter-1, NCS1 family